MVAKTDKSFGTFCVLISQPLIWINDFRVNCLETIVIIIAKKLFWIRVVRQSNDTCFVSHVNVILPEILIQITTTHPWLTIFKSGAELS